MNSDEIQRLKKIVCQQHYRLAKYGLVILTEGNVSQITPDRKYIIIKPSGVPYHKLRPEYMMVIDLDCNIIQGHLKPSVDSLIHAEVYKTAPDVFGIVHTHSTYVTAFAQAKQPLPCYGTTHADEFNGPVPITRDLTPEEIENDFEKNTGKIVIEVFNPEIPAVLVAGHGAFSFGLSSSQAVNNMYVLEKVAKMAILKTPRQPISDDLLKKHYQRKHGLRKYYGQS